MAFSCLASLVVDVVAVVESPLLEALLCLYDKSGILKPSEVLLCFHLKSPIHSAEIFCHYEIVELSLSMTNSHCFFNGTLWNCQCFPISNFKYNWLKSLIQSAEMFCHFEIVQLSLIMTNSQCFLNGTLWNCQCFPVSTLRLQNSWLIFSHCSNFAV